LLVARYFRIPELARRKTEDAHVLALIGFYKKTEADTVRWKGGERRKMRGKRGTGQQG